MKNISAIILAAGLSRRMGKPKMLLPWGSTTVLGRVIATFAETNTNEIVVITGGNREQVENEVSNYTGKTVLHTIFNPDFGSGEMLSSLQLGLTALSPQVESVLVALGDQPQVSLSAVLTVTSAFKASEARLIVPSYQMRRGHPWMVERSLWQDLLDLRPPQTLRTFLDQFAEEIFYVEADATILKDLDTPDQYEQEKP